MQVLKNQVKHVHVFVLTFNGQDPRLSLSLKTMIRLFVKMFGDHFWKNAIFEVTRWGFDPRSINNRISKGESEEKWKQEWNSRFQHEFKIDVRYYFFQYKNKSLAKKSFKQKSPSVQKFLRNKKYQKSLEPKIS